MMLTMGAAYSKGRLIFHEKERLAQSPEPAGSGDDAGCVAAVAALIWKLSRRER